MSEEELSGKIAAKTKELRDAGLLPVTEYRKTPREIAKDLYMRLPLDLTKSLPGPHIDRIAAAIEDAQEETFKYQALADELEGTLRKMAERALNGTPFYNAQEMCVAAEEACEAYRYACLSPGLRAAEDRSREGDDDE